MPLLIFLPVAAVSVCGLVAWWLWLRFCRHVYDQAGNAKAMREATVVATSFWQRGSDRALLSSPHEADVHNGSIRHVHPGGSA
jgi:hypothetical protein